MRDDPATPNPRREEAAESLAPAEAEALAAPPLLSHQTAGGGRGDLTRTHVGTPSVSPEWTRPSEGGGSERGGGAGCPASEEAEAEGGMVGGGEERV